jgi:hypothetical protein
MRNVENAGNFSKPQNRIPRLNSLKQEKKLKIKTIGKSTISIGRTVIDVSCVSQLVDPGQLSLIGDWLVCILKDEKMRDKSLKEICCQLEERGITSPLSKDIAIPYGDRVYVRRFEIAAAINRLRSLIVRE